MLHGAWLSQLRKTSHLQSWLCLGIFREDIKTKHSKNATSAIFQQSHIKDTTDIYDISFWYNKWLQYHIFHRILCKHACDKPLKHKKNPSNIREKPFPPYFFSLLKGPTPERRVWRVYPWHRSTQVASACQVGTIGHQIAQDFHLCTETPPRDLQYMNSLEMGNGKQLLLLRNG